MTSEQLQLFPTPTDSHPESPGRADSSATAPTTEGDGLSLLEEDTKTDQAQVLEILRGLADEFETVVDKRVDIAIFNWLMTYGMPKQPGDLRYFVQQVSSVVLGWCAANEYITFTDKAKASEEELAGRQVESAFEEVDTDNVLTGAFGNVGQYL